MSQRMYSGIRGKIATVVVFSGVANFSWAAPAVDLGQFTPDPRIIGYSVYTTDSIRLPDNSGLANGGLFGSGGGIQLGAQMILRAPYIGAGHNLSIGNSPINSYVPKLDVKGSLSLGGNSNSDSLIQVGGTLTFGGQPINLRGASTSAGTFGPKPAGDFVLNQVNTTIMPPPLVVADSVLPAYNIIGLSPPTTPPNVDLSLPANPATDASVNFLSPGPFTAYYWKCSAAGLPAGSCRGDTLLPGYYGNLNVVGNGRAILLTEGFYSFNTIAIGGGNAIITAQPTGGRTVIYALNGVTANQSHAFIGPDSARLATVYGTGPGKFLGGTLMLASGTNIVIPSDNRIWATLSAPKGDIHLASQVILFGQAFAKRLFGDNMIDFGAGAFIPFRGLIPPIVGLVNFSVQERTDTSCHDSSLRPCRDTVLKVSMPNTTAYSVIFQWTVVERLPKGALGNATGNVDFKVDSGWDTIPANSLTATIRVRIFDDSLYEGPESLWVILKNATAAGFANKSGVLDTSIKADTAVGVIIDNDLAPRIRIQRLSPRDSFPEGNSGTTPETFLVQLVDPGTGKDLAVRFAPQLPIPFWWGTSDGTATVANNDYVPVAGHWDTIPANAVNKTISVNIVGDTVYESDEWFLVHIDSLVHTLPTGNILSDTGWITNDDAPPIWITGDTVQEPSTGFVYARFPIHLTGPSKVPTSFVWRTVGGTATSGLDYAAVDSTVVTLPPGVTDTVLQVRVLADSVSGEGTETFQVVLSNLNGLTFGIGSATGSILDAPTSLHLSLDSVGRVVEADTTVHFHLGLNWYPADTVRVYFHTVSLGAHPGEQYRDTSGLLVFYPGKRLDSIPVSLFSDTVWEPDLSFALHLDSVVSRIPLTTDSVGIATIADNGPVPSVQYLSNDTSIFEHKAGTVAVRLGLSRPSGVPLSLVVPVLPASTAVLGTNFSFAQLATDTFVFPARTETGTFGVVVIPNEVEQPDRKVVLGLSPFSPLGKGADSIWTLTIIDDNHVPVVVITTPVDWLHTNQPTQSVCWTVDTVSQGCTDTLFPQGHSTVTRCNTNGFGNTGCDTNNVWVDTTPPAIQVFKITGPNTHNPAVDTTWWGKRARTRFGADTVWYWVRDSIENLDNSWRVLVDTQYKVTNFKGDGLYPVPVSVCDSVGNCGYDTGWIDLKQSIPGVSIVTPPEGGVVRVGTVPVHWIVADNGKTLVFDDTREIAKPGVDTVQRCYTDDVGNTGCDLHHILAEPIKARSGYYLDTDGDGRIDALVVNLDTPWTLAMPAFDLPLDTARRTGQQPDSLRPFYRVSASGKVDSMRLLVPIAPPFAFGVTGFPVQTGTIHETWSSGLGTVMYTDSFPIYDSVPPVILKSTIDRVENYKDPDTLHFTPSEPIRVTGKAWLEVGRCKNDSATCLDSMLVWHLVPADSVHALSDGTWWILVQPGDSGSVRPGYKLRFLSGVTDSLGNRVDSTKASWTSVVEGRPRPPLLQVTEPGKIPYIDPTERDRKGVGGILLQATSGDTTNMQWWEPGRGYLTSSDASVQSVCPDNGKYCNGPSIYVNFPVKMILYIYDHEGVFVITRTVNISQADIDGLKGDKIDRLKISIQWNHRTDAGKVVATGVYHWRVMSYVKLPGRAAPVISNQLFNLGVKVQGAGGLY